MKTEQIAMLLQIAGVLHLGLMAAGLMMPRVVNMRIHLATLPPFLQRLFWVYYTFIAFCLVSFGSLSFFFAGALASGTGLARAVCAFLAVFWTIRLGAALFVFEMRPYLTNAWRRLGYHAINIVFAFLPIIYAIAAWKRN
jgi:hypothetical protein